MTKNSSALSVQQEVINQTRTRETCKYSVYYNCVKDCFLKNTWDTVRNKHVHVFEGYMNGFTVFETWEKIKYQLKNK
jgi:hypothetical protein